MIPRERERQEENDDERDVSDFRARQGDEMADENRRVDDENTQ